MIFEFKFNIFKPNTYPNQRETEPPYPIVILLHLAFKTLSVLNYMFGTMITGSPNLIFSLIIILQSLDFWLVKNVTGRILVKLRWWIVSRYNMESYGMDLNEEREIQKILNKFYPKQSKKKKVESGQKTEGSDDEDEIDENEYHLVFESYDEEVFLNIINNHIFWIGELTSTGFWTLIIFVDILALNVMWAYLVLICWLLAFSNLYLYYLCYGYHLEKMRDIFDDYDKNFFEDEED